MPRFTVAVPGSGKTTEIVNYIDAYVTHEESRHRVANAVAITFTNEAANELRNRLSYLNKEYQQVTCCTIHSLSYLIAQRTLNKPLLSELKEEPGDLQSGSVPENLFYDRLLSDAERNLRDGYTFPVGLLAVDEAQDLSTFQYSFISALMYQAEDTIVVGDPMQSIYGFQGSGPSYMYMLHKQMGSSLEINPTIRDRTYRFGKEIADAINFMFPNSTKITSEKPGGTVEVKEIKSNERHSWLSQVHDKETNGILFRTNREIGEFIKKVEHKDKFNYVIEMSSHPLVALISTLLTLRRKIDLSSFPIAASYLGYGGFEVRRAVAMLREVENTGCTIDLAFLQMMFSAGSSPNGTNSSNIIITNRISTVMRRVIDTLGSIEIEDCDFTKETVHKVLDKVLELGYSVEKVFDTPSDTICEAVLNRVLRKKETLYKVDNKSNTTVMTMHSSKGKEFDHVAVAISPWADLTSEEEFRVLYVALTRAKESLKIALPGRNEVKIAKQKNIVDTVLSYKGII
jgi:superfamily I DNA/RNA helicase